MELSDIPPPLWHINYHLVWFFLLFFIALFLRGLFAFLETVITALRVFKLKEVASSVTGYQKLLDTLEHDPNRVLVSILIASSLAEVSAASIGTFVVEQFFAHFNWSAGLGFSIGIALTSACIVVLGEIIPKNIAKRCGEPWFRSLLWLINGLYYLVSPIAGILITNADRIIQRFKRTSPSEESGHISEKEIRFLIKYVHEKGSLATDKTTMIHNIFELGHTPVREVMTPATDAVYVDINTPMPRIIQIFAECHFSRLPVFSGSHNDIIGMVHQKDILSLIANGKEALLSQIIRPIMFTPENIKVSQLLTEFKQQHMHIAMVLNEHGIITGLITLEDVLEEIVGEITDEHENDLKDSRVVSLAQGGWMVDAATPLQELEALLAIRFQTENAITLGGFMAEQLQHMPKKGERIVYDDYYFQIQKANQRRVRQVLVFRKSDFVHHSLSA